MTSIRTRPVAGMKLMAESRGWLARRSSKTDSITVSGITTSTLARACLGSEDFMAVMTFW